MAAKIDILTSGYATLQVQPDTLNSGCKSSSSSSSFPSSSLAPPQPQPFQEGKFMRATGSCCLIRSSTMNVLFDTMGPWERDLLLERLSKFKIHPEDVNYLVCSHSHPDHVGNLNLFLKAKKHFVGTSVYSNDLYDLNCFEPIGSYKYKSPREDDELNVIKYQSYELDSNISIEPTQGHTMECISMIVNNCETYQTVALVGDLFENEHDVKDEGIWLGAGSQNSYLQRASRTRIYNKADYILPGHGELFKTTAIPTRCF